MTDWADGPAAVMRFCGGCNTIWLGYDSQSFGGAYRCSKCLAAYMAGFDPQPNSTVRFIDGPQLDYVVLARDGDEVTVRHLGFPDEPSFTASVHTLHEGPNGY